MRFTRTSNQIDILATMVGTVKFADDVCENDDDEFEFVTKSTFELTGREEPFFTKQFRLVTEFGNEHYENWKDSLKEVIGVTNLASSTTCSGAGAKNGDSTFSIGCGNVKSKPKTWTIQNLEPAKPKRNLSVQKKNPLKDTASSMQRLSLRNPMVAKVSNEKKNDVDAVKENKAELERQTENVYESITSGRVFLVPMNNTNESAYYDDQQVKLVHSDDSKDDNVCDDDAIDFNERKKLNESLSGVRCEDIGFDNGCELMKSRPEIDESRDPPPAGNDLKLSKLSQQQHSSFDYSPFEKLSFGNNKDTTTTTRRLPMHTKNNTTIKKLLQNHSHKSKNAIGSCYKDESVDKTVVNSSRISKRGNYRTRGYNKGMSTSKGSNYLLSTRDHE